MRLFPVVLGLFALTLGLFLPTSCTKENFDDFQDEELVEMIITVGGNTKTSNDGDSTLWSENDELSVIHSAPNATTFWLSPFTYYPSYGYNAFYGTVSKLSANNDWYAVYPYNASHTSAESVSLTFPALQTQTGNSTAHLAGTDFPMVGKATNVARSTDLSIRMENLLAVAEFKVKNTISKAITVEQIEFTASSPIAGAFSVNLTGDAPVLTAGAAATKTVKLDVAEVEQIAADGDGMFYMGVAPFQASAGTTLKFKILAKDADGNTIPFYYSLTLKNDATFTSNEFQTIQLDFDDQHQTNPDAGSAGEVELPVGGEPEDGVYLLVYENGANSYAFAAFADKEADNYAVPVVVENGVVLPSETEDLTRYAVNIENAGIEHPNDAGHDAYNVRNSDGKYIFYASGGGDTKILRILDTNELYNTSSQETVKYYHTFIQEEDGVQILSSGGVSGYNKYLLTYSDAKGFHYSNEEADQGKKLHLYLVGGSAKERQELRFAPSNVSYNFDNGGDFPEPTLSGLKTTIISWASSNTDVATVDANGIVTIKGPGSAIITVTADSDDTYYGATGTYTIESTSSSMQIWYKADEMEDGKQYLIVSNGYALQNNNGSVAATAVTVSNETITLNAPSGLLWTANSSNQLTNNNQSLGRSNSSSGGWGGYGGSATLAIGSNAAAWTYDAESNLLTTSISSQWGGATTYYLYYSNSSNAFTINNSSSDTHIAALYSTTKPADKQFLSFANSTVRWTVGDGGDHALNQSYDVQAVSGAATTVTYTSSNTDVATINGTRITLEGTGATTITATAKEENGYKSATAKYTLRVTTPAPAGFENLGSFNLENAALTGYLNDASVKYPADDKSTIANNTYASTSVISTYANWSSPSRKDIPAPVELSWSVASTGTATVTVYNDQALQDEVWTWTASEGSKSFDVYNLIPGLTYYCTVVDDSNGNYLLKGTFNTEGRRRMIKVSDTVNANKANNCRDLGGLKTTDGRRIKYGLIFRGTNMTNTTPDEKSIIAEFMNVGLDNDLRDGSGGGSNRDNPFENTSYTVRYIGPGYSSTGDLQDADKYKQTIQAFLDAAKPGTKNYNKASYFHCYIGADRTGYTGLMLEGLLGVSLTDCTIDYELTTFSTAAGSRARNSSSMCYIKDAVTFLNKEENGGTGTTLQEKITYYFINKLGISEADIENFKNWVLEPDPEAN